MGVKQPPDAGSLEVPLKSWAHSNIGDMEVHWSLDVGEKTQQEAPWNSTHDWWEGGGGRSTSFTHPWNK